MSEKLQKVLANVGLGSRREIEKWIEHGRVSVNGTVVTLGARVEATDQIRVDGRIINLNKRKSVCRVLMYNKPEGEMCTRKDPEGRPTVFDRLPRIKDGRWVAIGRLDINTSGLLLFTNDGELANRLMHPRHEVEREYAVRVFGDVKEQDIRKLTQGIKLEDGMAQFKQVKRRATVTQQGSDEDSLNQWFDVVLTEGRNREVRRMWESLDYKVSRLIRVRYGKLPLKKRLPQGAWVELPLEEINYLRETVQLPKETETVLDEKKAQLDHVRLSRMRRSVKKHKLVQQGVKKTPKTRQGRS
ncbi:23S rRNA pseudouridine(2605) synthase RluB [Bowmanella sp. JS7-9]|uniref:Pseudouridine synthase n=1 Tax=Pseudobowmanella zhangzhouensis TaxID=1537679 RepID=A0ABW1XJZ5_9ALTE|nr:23S rRNA pseudouridine(2605) synthase RluB [Bowmanella sp. JS7-9]TBX22455.1 ribosomal large subunit pseudouridine synthase B [Bowmanella sp. JS7-9]